MDRLTMLTELGRLAQEAALRGDDRAAVVMREAASLIYEDGAIALAVERRRDKDRRRKRRSTESKDSTESAESVESPSVFPHTPFPTPPVNNNDNRTRETLTDTATALLMKRMGKRWADVDAFLLSREVSTWGAWTKEMLKLITGGVATEDDLAQTCCDALALDRPLGSPVALRAFIGRAARERLAARTSTSSTPSGRGALVLQQIRELVRTHQQPGQQERRFIRKDDVKALGADVLKAYEAIGGAEALLSTPPDKFSFLIRDFSNALEAANAAA